MIFQTSARQNSAQNVQVHHPVQSLSREVKKLHVGSGCDLGFVALCAVDKTTQLSEAAYFFCRCWSDALTVLFQRFQSLSGKGVRGRLFLQPESPSLKITK